MTAWMNWPEDVVAGRRSSTTARPSKRTMAGPCGRSATTEPWEPIGVDPAEARLDYCRDLLTILSDVVDQKARRPSTRPAEACRRSSPDRAGSRRTRRDGSCGSAVESREPAVVLERPLRSQRVGTESSIRIAVEKQSETGAGPAHDERPRRRSGASPIHFRFVLRMAAMPDHHSGRLEEVVAVRERAQRQRELLAGVDMAGVLADVE